MKERFQLAVAYDGTDYAGFQEQPGRETVQSVLEKALHKILGEKLRVVPSGRTDAGVHALEQICHLDLESETAIERFRSDSFLHRLNSVLPESVAVTSRRGARGFHARIDSKEKTYAYVILNSPRPNPFLKNRVWHLRQPLQIKTMREASRHLVGLHDFTSFCASDSTVADKIRKIKSITFNTKPAFPFTVLPEEKYITLTFRGNGFLKQMIRNIVGTLVDVGRGHTESQAVGKILHDRDRRNAGRTAPAHGLYLLKADYGK